ncbi:hypothetical protein IV203_026526 [Nitzschia inconspicua]|uniref:Uncharacterized protein n=1 Tax=Nitzschia inconspicua TaxID=303405 RepID=A0A9K3LMG0_9STRA|nr:hypothetical protein IV203_026526 [Nitzschia inconspicua]
MFRSFSPSSTDGNSRRCQQQTASPVKGMSDNGFGVAYHGRSNDNDNDDKLHIVRDRTNETQTTAGESQATVSSLSGIYSTDLLKDVYALSGSESDSEYDAHDYSTDYIVGISKEQNLKRNDDDDDDDDDKDCMEIIDEVDLDAASECTTVTSNHMPYVTPYNNQSSFPAIVKNSSWVEDKPFDEESILNMSDVGVGNKATILPSYYSNNTIPIKEYILPPPAPMSLLSHSSTPIQTRRHVDEIIEISPDMETGRSLGRVAWAGTNVKSSADIVSESSSTVYASTMPDGMTQDFGAKGPNRSTVSSTSRDRSFKSDKELRFRRSKIFIFTGCLVALLCLIVIIVSVAMANKDRDVELSASAAESSQTPAPAANSTVVESSAPSLRPTAPPSEMPASATEVTEAKDTVSPESAAWLDNSPSPTGNPTVQPAPEPPEPTSEQSSESTPETTPDPTEAVTPAVCASRISVSQDCFFMSDNVLVVEFENCDPQPDDWIGLYPAGAEFVEESSGRELLTDNWVTWAWSCGDQACEVSPPANSFALSINPNDPTYNLFNLRAFLIRASASGPPYEVVAKTEPFTIVDPCNP